VIGLDTNVLVRYLTEDDPHQARRASALIQTIARRGEKCFIGPIVLCELSWVLRGAYDVSKADLLLTLDRMLATSQFVIGDKDLVRAALDRHRAGRADFADYLIGELHADEGCELTATFDRRLRGERRFQIL
jgi:predicted nucleic-acid-binding protein